ncbi:unnamed protein product [Nippostrongylus brasiliensis]|uniref:Uncharacterized protein n=1 Tax=Nippostrongylus brasiliensis TaxID=27835 RepID=A0A0N4YJ28_NIPBR|nr:unnamed protein product [Nippostrongylus brasiliensis]
MVLENAEAVECPERSECAQVSRLTDVDAGQEVEKILEIARQLPSKVEAELADARIAGKYRTQLARVINHEVRNISEKLEELKYSLDGHQILSRDLCNILRCRGIETLVELKEFIEVTERDGELVEDICDMFQTNAKQVRSVLGEMKAQMNPRPRKPSEEIEKMDTNTEKGNFERSNEDRRREAKVGLEHTSSCSRGRVRKLWKEYDKWKQVRSHAV